MHADLAGDALAHDANQLVEPSSLPVVVGDEANAKALAVAPQTMPAHDGAQRDPGKQGAHALELHLQPRPDRWVLVDQQEATAGADVVGLTDLDDTGDVGASLDVNRQTARVSLAMVNVVAIDEGQELGASGGFAGEKGQANPGRRGAATSGTFPADLGADTKTYLFCQEMNLELDLVAEPNVGVAGNKEPALIGLEGLLTKGDPIAQRQQQQWA